MEERREDENKRGKIHDEGENAKKQNDMKEEKMQADASKSRYHTPVPNPNQNPWRQQTQG